MEVSHRNFDCSCWSILTDFTFGRKISRWYGDVPFASGYFVVYGVLKIAYDCHQYSQVGKFQIAFKIRDSVDLIDFILRMTFRSSGLYVIFLALFSHYPRKKCVTKVSDLFGISKEKIFLCGNETIPRGVYETPQSCKTRPK